MRWALPTGIAYLDMLQQFLTPQTKMTKKEAFTSSKAAHPPHYLGEEREYLNTHFPGRWIGRVAQ
jgi:hypothetical protein